MKKQTIIFSVIFSFVFSNFLSAAVSRGDESITQGQVAKLLAYQLGLYKFLPANPTPGDCAAILQANGIAPRNEKWELDKTLTVADFAKVLVEAMGREDEVIGDKNDPKSFIQFLKSQGISIDSASEAISDIGAVAETSGGGINSELGTSDPVDERSIFGLPDETASGADAGVEVDASPADVAVSVASVTEIVSNVELSSDTLVRSPVTPN